MGCNTKKLQIQTAEKRGLFSSLFYEQGVYRNFQKQCLSKRHICDMQFADVARTLQTQTAIFANCSNLPQRIATIVWHNKGAFRENGTDIPHNLRKVLPAKAHAGTFSCGCGRSSGAQQAHKKLSPVSMRGNSQNGGQTTKSLLIKPQCSGVPIQQAVSLSSSFPRHCLLFVCAFFRKMQAGARSEEPPCRPVSCIQNRPGFHHGNRGGSFALGALFQALTQNLARGLLVSPAYAGKSSARELLLIVSRDHPRVCGEKIRQSIWYSTT